MNTYRESDPYFDKFIGSRSGRHLGDGENFSIDGKTLYYRDPQNKQTVMDQSDMEMEINPNAKPMYNPLYAYDYGAIKDAGDVLGIKNVNKQEEVDQLLEYLGTPRASQADLDALSDSPFGGSKATGEEMLEPEGYELSPEFNAAIDRNRDFEETRMAGDIFSSLSGATQEDDRPNIVVQGGDNNDFLYEYAKNMRFG